jgi:hypothetical protein
VGVACWAFLTRAVGLSALRGARWFGIERLGEVVRSEEFLVFSLTASCRGHDTHHSMSPVLQGKTRAFGNLSEETAMPHGSVACGQQLVEADTLETPTGFARDVTQLALVDEPGVFGWQKQNVFLDGGRE